MADNQDNFNKIETAISQIAVYLGIHPLMGFVLSIVFYVSGFVNWHFLLQIQKTQEETHIPIWVIQSFQIFAFICGSAAGLATCYGVYKTHHSKKKKGE